MEGKMRAFEFHEGEVVGHPVGRMIVNLDHLVTLYEIPSDGPSQWVVQFSHGGVSSLTKPAFDRILLAWKSN
jgi:hypothetical protein